MEKEVARLKREMQIPPSNSASEEQLQQLEKEKAEWKAAAEKLQQELNSGQSTPRATPSASQEQVTIH